MKFVRSLSKIIIPILLMLGLVAPAFAEDINTATGTRKEKVETRTSEMKEKMASREASLKAKLQTFRDQKKAAATERINTNLNAINDRQTGAMLKHLEYMTKILDRLESRVNAGSADIKDPTVARAAIAESRAKIASATVSVNTQSANDYTITVTSETTVKVDAQKMRDMLRSDLKAVREEVIAAKQSVGTAIRAAKSGTAVKEGTPNGSQ